LLPTIGLCPAEDYREQGAKNKYQFSNHLDALKRRKYKESPCDWRSGWYYRVFL